MSWIDALLRSRLAPPEARRIKYFWAWEATWVGVRVVTHLFLFLFLVCECRGEKRAKGGRKTKKKKTKKSRRKKKKRDKTHALEMFLQSPLPNLASPAKKALCSSSDHGIPLRFSPSERGPEVAAAGGAAPERERSMSPSSPSRCEDEQGEWRRFLPLPFAAAAAPLPTV